MLQRRRMSCRFLTNVSSLLITLSLIGVPITADAQKLHFVRAIGEPWQEGQWNWMGYVAFNADGKSIIADGVGDGGGIWSFPEGTQLRQLAFRPFGNSPDFRYYAWGKGYGEVETGKVLFSFPNDEYGVVTFSLDGRLVARSVAGAARGAAIEILQLGTGAVVSQFSNHGGFSLSISPDNRVLASGHWDLVQLWDIATGHRLRALRGMNRYIESLGFSPDGTRLAAGSDFGNVQLWDVSTGARVCSVKLPGGYVSSPAFSPDGALVAIGVYGTGTVWLLEAKTCKVIDQSKISDLGCGAAAFSPDGRFLIVPSTGGLIRWPRDYGGTIRVFELVH
jgi:WD40 repeat protein